MTSKTNPRRENKSQVRRPLYCSIESAGEKGGPHVSVYLLCVPKLTGKRRGFYTCRSKKPPPRRAHKKATWALLDVEGLQDEKRGDRVSPRGPRPEPKILWGGFNQQNELTRAYAQQLVTTRLLDCLHDPVRRPSRLQGFHPSAR